MNRDGVSAGGEEGIAEVTRGLFRRGSVYTVATGFQLAAGAVLIPVLTRVLASPEYGILATLLVVVQLLAHGAGLGFQSSITREYFDRHGSRVARSFVPVPVVTAALIVVLLDLTMSGWCGIFAELRCDLGMRLALWSTVPIIAQGAAQALLRAEGRAGVFAVVAVVGSVGAHGVGIGAVILVERTATAFFLGFLAGQVASATIGLLVTWVRGIGSYGLPKLGRLRRGLFFGLPTVPHTLALYVMSAGDRVVIERVLGLEAVARYQPAYVVGALGMMGLGALNNAWSPLILGAPEKQRWEMLAGTAAWVDRLVAPVAGALMLSAPLLMRIAVPATYGPDALAEVATIVALSVMAHATYLASVHILFSVRRTGVLAWAAPVSAMVNVGLNLLLLPVWGLRGAAAATVVAYTLLAVTVGRAARRHAQVRWRWSERTKGWLGAGLVLLAALALPVDAKGMAVRITGALALATWALVEAGGWRRRDPSGPR